MIGGMDPGVLRQARMQSASPMGGGIGPAGGMPPQAQFGLAQARMAQARQPMAPGGLQGGTSLTPTYQQRPGGGAIATTPDGAMGMLPQQITNIAQSRNPMEAFTPNRPPDGGSFFDVFGKP